MIGQQVPTFARDMVKASPDGRFSMDKWDGYVAARQRLYARLQETKAPNPIVLSGDVHVHFGADLKPDFTDPRSATVGVEFTNSSVTSGGDGSDVSASGSRSRATTRTSSTTAPAAATSRAPRRPRPMRADFKILDQVTVPDLPTRTGGSLVVEAGRPGGNTD